MSVPVKILDLWCLPPSLYAYKADMNMYYLLLAVWHLSKEKATVRTPTGQINSVSVL